MPSTPIHRRARFSLLTLAITLAAATFIPTSTHVQAHADRKTEGAELFITSGCTHCHGPAMQGTEKGPSLLNVQRKLTAEAMHKQIAQGGDAMPPFADALTDDQITSLVEFLRTRHAEKLLTTVKVPLP